MSKFFINPDAVDTENNCIVITGEDVRHIKNVLRSKQGDILSLSDGSGREYETIIEKLDKESILVRIKNTDMNKTEPPLYITLFQGIPKGDKMEYIIQKCVEVGVSRFVPVLTGRTVVKLDSKKDSAAKTARWRRIALEAAKQCDRGIIPVVEEPVGMDDALKLSETCGLKIIPYEEETEGSLRKCLESWKQKHLNEKGDLPQAFNEKSIAVFIGPEGGFEPGEVDKAAGHGFVPVTLGPRILRTETAGLVVSSIIMYELGDI